MKAPDTRGMRAGGTLLLAIVLSLASPAAALADPGTLDPSVSVTDPTGATGTTTATVGVTTTDSTTTISATTTGTTAAVTVPQSTTIGSTGTVTSPSTTGISTGSGPVTTRQTVTPSGSGATSDQTVSTSVTDSASPALVFGQAVAGVTQGLTAGLTANDPTTRTTVSAGAMANAVLCLLAQISVDPSRATLSSLCNGGPSTADGAAQLSAANAITGTSVSAAPTLRAAACLLALVSSSAPRTIDARDLASASLSTLCGGATASTVDAGGDVHLTEDRTGTDISAAPIAALAACLLANATVGTTTAAQLATLCGGAAGSPSTVTGGAPTQVTDGTTGTSAGVAPAANAALCLLLDALGTIPSDPTDASAVAALSTACGSSTGTTPSTIDGTAPATAASSGGTNAEVTPSLNAALCLLAQAGVSAASSTVQLSNACGAAGVGGGNTTTTTTTTNGGTPTQDVSTGPGTAPQPGVQGVSTAPQQPGVLGFSGLPSTSTELLGGFSILLIALGTSLAMTQRRRR